MSSTIVIYRFWTEYKPDERDPATMRGIAQHARRVQWMHMLAEPLLQRRWAGGRIAVVDAVHRLVPLDRTERALPAPQAQARGAVVDLPHPLTPDLRLVASPMKLSATPVTYRHAPPLLGQHSDELLREAGCADAEIAAWRAAGVIA